MLLVQQSQRFEMCRFKVARSHEKGLRHAGARKQAHHVSQDHPSHRVRSQRTAAR